jgi:hypothetical protein
MSERVEHFGSECDLPEPKVIGFCLACDDEIYEFLDMVCPLCGEIIHEKCQVRCFTCSQSGCIGCMELDREQMEFNCRDCT